jgi:thiamine-monophosphate kinase
MKEFYLIKNVFKSLTNDCKASQGLSDDVAIINTKEFFFVSNDTIVEDVHFLKKDGGFKIASKLLLSNLSDLAASGAKPVYYLLGFSKNDSIDEGFFYDFARGLKSVQNEYNLDLIGGDTVHSPSKLFFSVTIFGVGKKSLSRKNAKNNDLIFVSGSIGDAYLGLLTSLKKLKTKDEYLLNRHFFPTARINLGIELSKQKLSNCAIDVSDGFLADLKHICEESKLSAFLDVDKIPISKNARVFLNKNLVGMHDLITAGDDYEIIFTAKKKNYEKIMELSKRLTLSISCVGYLKKTSENPKINFTNNYTFPQNFSNYGYEH